MRKISVLILFLIVSVPIILLAACDDESETPTPSDYELREESRRIAEDFVIKSPTFQFDGIKGSIRQIDIEEPAGLESWRFLYRFDSEHPGYGDRTDEQPLDAQITPHEAAVTVSKGEVTKAIMDGEWDMLEQKETGEWEWGQAGEQALYGVISVFTVLILLILLTRLSSFVIAKIEGGRSAASEG